MQEKRLNILIGNIGSGKSTRIKNKPKNVICVSRDALRYMIGGGDYIFNEDLEKAICFGELKILEEFMKIGASDIIIDETNIAKLIRQRYLKLADKYNYKKVAIQMPILSKKESVDRRMKDPHGQPDRTLWERVWEKFNDIYEPPSFREGFDEIIKIKNE